MEIRELTCIGCPMGCPLTVTIGDEITVDHIRGISGSTIEDGITVTGNTCPRGAIYAKKEVTNPTRIVTSSVRVNGGEIAMVSVKTANDIPKGKIFDIMAEISKITVDAPVAIGDVIIENVADTGVNVIATKNVICA